MLIIDWIQSVFGEPSDISEFTPSFTSRKLLSSQESFIFSIWWSVPKLASDSRTNITDRYDGEVFCCTSARVLTSVCVYAWSNFFKTYIEIHWNFPEMSLMYKLMYKYERTKGFKFYPFDCNLILSFRLFLSFAKEKFRVSDFSRMRPAKKSWRSWHVNESDMDATTCLNHCFAASTRGSSRSKVVWASIGRRLGKTFSGFYIGESVAA